MDDLSIQKLVEAAIMDPERKALYIDALPYMTAEEKIVFSLSLWDTILAKVEIEAQIKIENKLLEMADSGEEVSKEEFRRIKDEVLTKYIAKQFDVNDTASIDKLKSELNELTPRNESE
ncbi:hypothetical protein CO180_03395 [candidate division WWE3 bacterium CG_4_9_14_3_um_filter_41_6]|uniref:Uncharacterized protein n=1 Tax=candidate division WWE3 bacterium CG_4_10_14_0_2_um_filter_41_14 TaxID=1975072 RepID=A0A2M7TIH6_UNCKA|nr:MAG: hypothetical protein COY32_03800 [candidate division WWE3 bacterium CG_4_10_14_0_2_um_filter_41_14]PJA38504.1 MAG: hypothetical protein CO180_03395 [candidate division WWE3 bacterium CG_4_9_14_3_um_filter_41_6]